MAHLLALSKQRRHSYLSVRINMAHVHGEPNVLK